ncbi:hypothetical protein M0802_001545 [Mischocyttarus mexicanus]|nr:hypothetical protein M0802_001545 [Mischocyttarus mexicanus]
MENVRGIHFIKEAKDVLNINKGIKIFFSVHANDFWNGLTLLTLLYGILILLVLGLECTVVGVAFGLKGDAEKGTQSFLKSTIKYYAANADQTETVTVAWDGIMSQGCYKAILTTVEENAAIVIGVAAGLVLVEILVITMALYLACVYWRPQHGRLDV